MNTITNFETTAQAKQGKLSLVLLIIAMLLMSPRVFGQNNLISPTGDGGFESGTTFAANGWTAVNANASIWEIGTGASQYAGNRGIYTINTTVGTFSYKTGGARTSHFYRDVAIPSGANNITLTFYWKGKGEAGWDRALVYTAPTSVTPVANSPASSSTSISGATLVWTQPEVQTTLAYTYALVSLPNSLAGTTVRLIFTWQNDGSGGTTPGAAIDNIGLEYCNSPSGDQSTYGSNSWIGYVYNSSSAGNFTTYKGFVTESESFDRDMSTGPPTGATTSMCSASADLFAIRYKMNKTYAAGVYTFTVGGDDGFRLSIDGGSTWLINDWGDHGYRTTSASATLSGSTNIVLEYYENTGGARCSFSVTSGQPTVLQGFGNTQYTTCGGTFYDSGGSAGNYSNNENYTVTFYPATVGSKVRLTFSSFSTESGFDYLYVYDGNSTSSAQISGSPFNGTSITSVITSTASDGSLTINFTSDGSNVGSWAATVSCYAPCTTPTTSFNLTGGGSYCSNGTAPNVGLSGSQSGVSYQLYKDGVATGSAVAGTGSAISFGAQSVTAGTTSTYTVQSTTAGGYCATAMSGSPSSVTVTQTAAPNSVNAGADVSSCSGASVTLSVSTSSSSSLSSVLSAVNSNSTAILNSIPSKYSFSMDCTGGGVNGNDIHDGGNDMYDYGNYINTNLESAIYYSDNSVISSASFGSGGSYFTRFLSGSLFVWAADINGLSSISITGDNGADGTGSYASTSFNVTSNGVTYTCFFKKVYGAGDPSINQLFIVPNGSSVTQSVGNSTNLSDQTLSSLSGVTRFYYLLFAGTSGLEYSTAQATTLAQTFVNIIPAPTYSWSSNPAGTSSTIASVTVSPTQTTTYTATVTMNGCSASDDVVVSMRTLPAATAANNSPVCSGSPVNLTASNMAPSGQFITMANNATDQTSGVSYSATTANHTMEFWVNPNRTIVLHSQTNTGISVPLNAPTTEYCFAIYPTQGASTGSPAVPTTAGVGVSVGTNGVEVVQHSGNHFPVTLSYSATLSGWTHIAVVHISNVPYLYVNGNLVKTGVSSLYPTFPGSGVSMPYGYFSGSLDNLRTWSTSRTVSEILANMNLETPVSTTGLLQNLPFNGNGTALTGSSVTVSGSTYGTPTYYTYTWSGTSAPAAGTGATQATSNLTNSTSSATTSNYTVVASGGGCSGTASTATTVTINPKPAINNMTATTCSAVAFTVTPVDATNGVVPSGTTYSWSAPVVTGGMTGGASGSGAASISGTLTNTTGTAQTATYTVTPATTSCTGAAFTVTVTVNAVNTAGAASASPSACINSAMTNITHTTTGATGIGAATGLPTGVTAAWASNTITISGTPSVSGTFNYSIPLTGGCGSANASGTITVSPASVGGTATATAATICSGGTTTVTVTGYTGTIQWQQSANGSTGWTNVTGGSGATSATYTTPALTSTTYYRAVITSGSCTAANSTTATVSMPTALVSGTHNTTALTVCVGNNPAALTITAPTTGMAPYTYQWKLNGLAVTTGTGGTTLTYDEDVQSSAGTYSYTCTTTDACGTSVTSSAKVITVVADPIVTNPSNITECVGGTDALSVVGSNGTPSLTYQWYSNTINSTSGSSAIGSATSTSYTPVSSSSGTMYYYCVVSATGSACNNATSGIASVIVSPLNTAGAASSSPSLCINAAMTSITHTTTGATGIGTATGLPSGVTAAWASNTITISGTPTSSGTYNYSIPLTGGCGSVNATGTITVNAPVLAQSISPMNGDYVWQGSLSTAWATAGNWLTYNGSSYNSANTAPNDPALRTFVPDYSGGCTTYDPTISGTVSTDNLTITVGASVTIPAGSTFILSGSLSNSGTLINSGTLNVESNWVNNGTFTSNTGNEVVFNGTGASTIGGSSANNFYKLTINKSTVTAVATFASALNTVTNQLTLTGGVLDIAGYDLDMGSLTISGGLTSSSYIRTSSTGVLKRNVGASDVLFPIGNSAYNPATLNNVGTSDKYSVRVIDNVTDNGTGVGTQTSKAVVNRTWMIDEAVAGSSNVTLRLNWNNGETINSFNAVNAFIAHYESASSMWDNMGGTVGSNYISVGGLTSFSPYTISSDGSFAPLPIELMSFQANCSDNNTVDVTWSTASEHNTNYFRVDKSRNGTQWDVLGTIGAAGNSTYTIDYALTDQFPNPGINYYRLTQYDLDGVFETFDVQAAVCKDQQAGTALSTYPNPSSGDFNVDLQTEELEGEGILIVSDAKGAVIHSQDIKIIKGTNNYIIQHLQAEPGIYYISVKAGASTVTTKHSLR